MRDKIRQNLVYVIFFRFLPVTIGSYIGLLMYLERYKKNYRSGKFGTPSHTVGLFASVAVLLDVILVASFFFGLSVSIPMLVIVAIFRCVISFYSVKMIFHF